MKTIAQTDRDLPPSGATAMRFGSLFSGIGGFDLGLERAGMECVWQVEIDPFCRTVLEKHWPSVWRHDDVMTMTGQIVCEKLRQVDLVCGGFPCKQTSTAAEIHGKRNGLSGRDSGLWWKMLEIVSEIKPRWVIVENTGGAKRWKDAIEGGLEDAGYFVQRHEPTASSIGAPHRRRRMFWVANRDGKRFSITWPSGSSEIEASPWGAFDGNSWVPFIPGVLRVDDGSSHRLDRRQRITAIGNAVVPAVAECIGKRIMACEAEQSR